MQQNSLDKLEWQLLLSHLVSFSQTEEGKSRASQLKPALKPSEIEARWDLVTSLVEIVRLGHSPMIGELQPVASIIKAAAIGEVLEGLNLRDIYKLLDATKNIVFFSKNIAPNCHTLESICYRLRPFPELYHAIANAISESGEINDQASPVLKEIRQGKRSLKQRIEQKLEQLLNDQDLGHYLQDHFYTLRHERYVLPIKLDGRGRVQGSIIDTSSSGQTLFIEPAVIIPMNESLRDLELSEKLEMIRILNEFTQKIAAHAQHLSANYQELIELDVLNAQAHLGYTLDARRVILSDKPTLQLTEAYHPLLKLSTTVKAIPNDILLHPEQNVLVISGPNAGGKTLVLKTVGLLHMMVSAGLLVPVSEQTQMFPFKQIFIELGDMQNISANLSTFSGHIKGLIPLINHAEKQSLILLDELCVGTEPETGSAMAQAILESLVEQHATVIITTHYDKLKLLAMENTKFRNGSMGYSHANYLPTYQLIFDVPGRSFGLEMAENLGMKASVISRAKTLRTHSTHLLDEALTKLSRIMDAEIEKQKDLEKRTMEAMSEKARWQNEVKLIEETRHNTAQKLGSRYEDLFSMLKDKFESTLQELKSSKTEEELLKNRHDAHEELATFKEELLKLRDQNSRPTKLPGHPAVFERLQIGDRVYVTSFQKEGRIAHLGKTSKDKIEVQTGTLKVKVTIHNLRLVSLSSTPRMNTKHLGVKPAAGVQKSLDSRSEGSDAVASAPVFIQTVTNACDLRGMTSDEALTHMWRFIDSAMLRGEASVYLIHGHGSDILKQAIRSALNDESPYALKFVPGSSHDGGDGVTIVYFVS